MSSFKTRYGADWPSEMSDAFIGMTVAKKWRRFRDELGVEFKDPWVPLLDAAKALVPEEYFKVSEWTEQHFHDWVMAEKGAITWGAASSGKALLPDEPVYYCNRTGRIADVKPGDEIFSATGELVRVRGKYHQVDMPLYRVRFANGTETICAKDHLWTVRYWGRVRWEGPRRSRKGVMGYVTRTLPVDRIASWSNLRRRRVSVPLPEPVQFDSSEVPVDPYVLGVLIGDASMTGTVLLSSAEPDAFVRDEVNRRLSKSAPGYGLVKVGKSSTTYMLVNTTGHRPRNPVVSALKDLGLFGHVANDKFIPDCYKFNSVDARYDLVAGLFDTDGTVDRGGHVSFTTVSRRLAEDVRFVLGSLGMASTMTEKRTCAQTAYTVYVRDADPARKSRLFKLPRKAARVRSGGRSHGRLAITSVEPVVDRSSYPRDTYCITVEDRDVKGNPTNGLFPIGGFVVTHNSNDYGLLMVLDWMTDPFDTAIRLGSTDKVSLKSRSWESVLRYFTAIRKNRIGLAVPGKVSKSGYAILNDDTDDNALSIGEKAGIVGVAVNDAEDSGKLQGAHAKYVRLVIDELATITHHQNIQKAISNLRVGADFRFYALANPSSWEDQSCQYCIPEKGPESVNVDTGCWMSTRGYIIRHHDGYKSPALKSPEAAARFPFLMTREVIDQNLADCDGNEDAPLFWQMVRGFPPPSGVGTPVVLDPRVAREGRVTDPPPPSTVICCAAGCDPAWSEGGDGAIYVKCLVRQVSPNSYPILDFSNMYRLKVMASSPAPVTQQLRDQVLAIMRGSGGHTAPLIATAVDASANQGLADDLDIYIGRGVTTCMHVNNSERASDYPVRANAKVHGRERFRDRAAEAWGVLAEFCKAGMVKGLPQEALRALQMRRYMTSGKSVVPKYPLQLERKEDFKERFKKSPDEADACALAALAVKEVLGILPFGWLPAAPEPLVGQADVPAVSSLAPSEELSDGIDGYDAIDDM